MDLQALIIRIAMFVIFIFSVIAHEVAHGAVALALGDPTAKQLGRLTLNPIRHIDLFGSIILPGLLLLSPVPFVIGWAKPVPYNPYNFRDQRKGSMIVGLAGPLTNIFLAGAFALGLRFLYSADLLGIGNGMIAMTFLVVVVTNMALAVLNLIPVPPLDGSKILPLLFGHHADRLEAAIRGLGPVGLFLIILLIFPLWSRFLGPLAMWAAALLMGPAAPPIIF